MSVSSFHNKISCERDTGEVSVFILYEVMLRNFYNSSILAQHAVRLFLVMEIVADATFFRSGFMKNHFSHPLSFMEGA